eukprot:3452164-Pleurochrysis_carterae.AAC.2
MLALPLKQLYANMRSIAMSQRKGSMVGWDCVIKWLSGATTQGVTHLVSEERIAEFIKMYPLLESNYRALQDWVLGDASRAEASAFMKDMDADVAQLKNLFITKIGRSWHSATRANTQSMLGITRGTA